MSKQFTSNSLEEEDEIDSEAMQRLFCEIPFLSVAPRKSVSFLFSKRLVQSRRMRRRQRAAYAHPLAEAHPCYTSTILPSVSLLESHSVESGVHNLEVLAGREIGTVLLADDFVLSGATVDSDLLKSLLSDPGTSVFLVNEFRPKKPWSHFDLSAGARRMLATPNAGGLRLVPNSNIIMKEVHRQFDHFGGLVL